MSCERYKHAMVDAAAAGDAPPSFVRTHMESCASCRVSYEREKSLFAAIDGNLRAASNVSFPVSLVSAVRIGVSRLDASASRRWASARWPRYAAAVVAVGLLIVLFPPRWNRDPIYNAQKDAIASTRSSSRAPDLAVQPAPPPKSATTSRVRRVNPTESTVASDRGLRVDRREVLVPPDQEVLLARYARALRDGSLRLSSIDVTQSASLGAPIEAVEVSAMEFLPLPELGSDAGSDGKPTTLTVNGALR
jgi:hypothetical protein